VEKEQTKMQTSKNENNYNLTNDIIAIVFALVGVIALLIVRIALFYNEWGDLIYFRQWISEYQNMSFIEGLGTKIGNYNPPYMYILNIIARINVSEVYLIKIVSIIFDFIIAFFVMRIVSLKTDSLNMHVLAFLLAFAIPTVLLNSSMWGQCDSIYAAFAIGSFYYGLRGRSKAVYILMALAISFKLQAVFLLPMIPVFVLKDKIKLKDCYWFFVAYIAALLPAVLSGMPVGVTLSTYVDQANTFASLNMNIVNVWQLVSAHVDYNAFLTAGLYIAGLAVLGLLYFTFVNRQRLVSNTDYIRLAFLFSIMMPFLLPKMHDRYYFIADVLSLLVFLFDKRRWYVPVISIFCSYLGYAYFLMNGIHLIDYRLAALALLFVILVVLRDYVISLYPDAKSTTTSENA